MVLHPNQYRGIPVNRRKIIQSFSKLDLWPGIPVWFPYQPVFQLHSIEAKQVWHEKSSGKLSCSQEREEKQGIICTNGSVIPRMGINRCHPRALYAILWCTVNKYGRCYSAHGARSVPKSSIRWCLGFDVSSLPPERDQARNITISSNTFFWGHEPKFHLDIN